MGNYLISGLSSTGKSSISHELEKLGYKVYDTDVELGFYGNFETGQPVLHPDNPSREWFKHNGWIWDGDKLKQLLRAKSDVPVFICGGSRNERKFYGLFDAIFVLHIPDEVMRDRLTARGSSKINTPLFITRMIEYNQDAYRHASSIGATVVETTEPIEACVQKVLATIHER
jgi:dephospho-CoA kinase